MLQDVIRRGGEASASQRCCQVGEEKLRQGIIVSKGGKRKGRARVGEMGIGEEYWEGARRE
jgi:hypothetical protein